MFAHTLLYGTLTGTPRDFINGNYTYNFCSLILTSLKGLYKWVPASVFLNREKSMEELNFIFFSLNIEGREGIMSKNKEI